MITRNELQSFEEEFFKKIREHDAWKEISGLEDFPWSEKIIDRNADKWDWNELCGNRGIRWDVDLIEKFKSRINWMRLSETMIGNCRSRSKVVNWSIIKKFESYWNWELLSFGSSPIPKEILEQFVDKWDWAILINNSNIDWTFELFDKFKRYIPVADFEKLQRSSLWRNLVEIEEQIIIGKILNDN